MRSNNYFSRRLIPVLLSLFLTNGAFSAPSDAQESWLRSVCSYGPDQVFKTLKWLFKNPVTAVTALTIASAQGVSGQVVSAPLHETLYPYCVKRDTLNSTLPSFEGREAYWFEASVTHTTRNLDRTLSAEEEETLHLVLAHRAKENLIEQEYFVSEANACIQGGCITNPSDMRVPIGSCISNGQNNVTLYGRCIGLLSHHYNVELRGDMPSGQDFFLRFLLEDGTPDNLGLRTALYQSYASFLRAQLMNDARAFEVNSCTLIKEKQEQLTQCRQKIGDAIQESLECNGEIATRERLIDALQWKLDATEQRLEEEKEKRNRLKKAIQDLFDQQVIYEEQIAERDAQIEAQQCEADPEFCDFGKKARKNKKNDREDQKDLKKDKDEKVKH
jgi:hypothetical protein